MLLRDELCLTNGRFDTKLTSPNFETSTLKGVLTDPSLSTKGDGTVYSMASFQFINTSRICHIPGQLEIFKNVATHQTDQTEEAWTLDK